MLCCLDLLEQISMIPFFDPQNRVQTVRMQGLDVCGIRTQAVFGDNEFEVGVVLAELDEEAFGRVAFTIGSGISGITSRTSGWIIAAPNI